MMILGICFLVVGVFVGRPYCRYLCPYGAILGLCSRWARWHVRIPPANCIQCRLCEEACPYGAIRQPTREMLPEEKGRGRRRLLGAFLLFPMLVGLGFVLGLGLGYPLARLHPTVRLAEYVYQVEKSGQEKTEETDPALKLRNDAVEAFRNTGRPPAALYEEASQHWFPLEVGKFLKCLLTFQFARAAGLLKTFHWLGGGLGAWAGLVIGIRLIALSLHRRRVDYEPDRANCVSCGRCFWYCPHEQVRLGLIDALPVVPADTEIKPPECTHL
jgi:ferredoxin